MDGNQATKRPNDQEDQEEHESKKRHVAQPRAVIRREPSIFNHRPPDDITKYIADFVGAHCATQNVEIEAKLGLLIDKNTNQRINMGSLTETVLGPGMERLVRFESDMSLQQHRQFNIMLNDLVNKSNAPDYKGEQISYKHTKETDRLYTVPGSKNKWRVTTDQKTGQVVPNGIVEKRRIADLNIHSPTRPMDYRISINVEIPRTMPTTQPVYERIKDRLSYKHGGISFDLTQVKLPSGGEKEVRHELELEIIDTKELAEEREKMARREPSQYMERIEAFVNNIRMLSRGT